MCITIVTLNYTMKYMYFSNFMYSKYTINYMYYSNSTTLITCVLLLIIYCSKIYNMYYSYNSKL